MTTKLQGHHEMIDKSIELYIILDWEFKDWPSSATHGSKFLKN